MKKIDLQKEEIKLDYKFNLMLEYSKTTAFIKIMNMIFGDFISYNFNKKKPDFNPTSEFYVSMSFLIGLMMVSFYIWNYWWFLIWFMLSGMIFILFRLLIFFCFKIDTDEERIIKTLKKIKVPKEIKEQLLKKAKERREDKYDKLYEPPIFTDEEAIKYNVSKEYVNAQKYLNLHYKDLTDKYGDQIWLIVGENGVLETAEDLHTIDKIFVEKNYEHRAIMTQVGKRESDYQNLNLEIIPIENDRIHHKLLLYNPETLDLGLEPFILDTGAKLTTITKEDFISLKLKNRGYQRMGGIGGSKICEKVKVCICVGDAEHETMVVVDSDGWRLLGMDILTKHKFYFNGIDKTVIFE